MNKLGKDGEELAIRFLKKKGYIIVERNYRTPFGEIDIIAKDGEVVVFAEVKTRADETFGRPFEAVDWKKKDKIRKVALSFLKRLKKEPPARFDVLSISTEGDSKHIEHIQDAFEV